MHESFCSLPWTGLDISPQGNFKPCCKYQYTIANDIETYFNSQELSEIKKDFLSGKKPGGCYRCWNDESLGIPSKRQLDLKYVHDNIHPSLDSLKIISMPFGNTCNLACRTCDSESSSFWVQSEKKLKKEFPNIEIKSHKKFYKDKKFIDRISELSKDVKLFEFPGGEPFLTGTNEHLNFLKSLVSENSKNLKLHYTTNATIFPDERFWSIWKQFKNVDLMLSLDGTKDHFEYNRWPAKWDVCYANIKKYQEKQQEFKNVQISISHTVSVFTIFYLPEFIKWCLKEKLPFPYFGILVDPGYYSVRVLPQSVKNFIEKNPIFNTEKLKPVLLELEKESDDFDMFVKYVKLLDNQRGQSFAEVFPEYSQRLGIK